LGPIKDTFDALYATGLSGVTVASVVTYLMKKPLLILRTVASDGTTRSHGTLLEGVVEHQAGIRYMILDDFVCNGSTLRRLLNHLPGTGTLAGVCLYTHPRQMSEGELGFAKEFHTDPATAQQKRWRLVRRGRESILFDLILQRGWRNPAALEPTNG
jgi:orotate phosphoribosyltransferase